MLLTGTYTRTLDEKHRVAIPSRLRKIISADDPDAEGLYVAPGQDGCVALYPPMQFDRLGEQLDEMPYTRRSVRRFRRFYFGQAGLSKWDGQGRIRIPELLLDHAKIPTDSRPRDVVLVGSQRHLEVWHADQWQTFFAEAEDEFDEISERALERGPAPPERTQET